MKLFRVHSGDIAYLTQQPRGLFTAVGRLVESKVLSEDEIAEYWRQRHWFEDNLPVPPFYADGNSIKAITWYKDNEEGRQMFAKMTFYLEVCRKYGLDLFLTTTSGVPGRLVYEDAWQIGVVEPRHEGKEFETHGL